MFKLLQINFVLIVLIFSLIPFELFGLIGISGNRQTSSFHNSVSKQENIENLKCFQDGSQCYNSDTKETWKLAWRDEFDYREPKDLYSKWKVDHSVKRDCSGSLKVSCNSRANVKFSKGMLTLTAKYDDERYQYTSAAVNSAKLFDEGRYEIKAQLPFEDGVRATILTKSPQEANFHQFGIMSYIQTTIIYRTVRTQEGAYGFDDLDDNNFDSKGFHLYGVEWNQTHARFFFDNLYGQVFRVRPGELVPQQQIRLQISVGGSYFQSSKCDPFVEFMDMDSADVLSDCNHDHDNFRPTRKSMKSQFVIDYVRIYQK